MCCGRCCVTELRLITALRLDIFIEILLDTWVNKGKRRAKALRSGPSRYDWRALLCALAAYREGPRFLL
jgi:hypothetical protein